VAPVIKFLEASSRDPWTEAGDVCKEVRAKKINSSTYGQGIRAK
jgi:hypothetical protein